MEYSMEYVWNIYIWNIYIWNIYIWNIMVISMEYLWWYLWNIYGDMYGISDISMIMTAWWYTYPSEKYEFVNWDDDIPNMWEKKKCSKPPTNFRFQRWILFIKTSQPKSRCLICNLIKYWSRHILSSIYFQILVTVRMLYTPWIEHKALIMKVPEHSWTSFFDYAGFDIKFGSVDDTKISVII